MLTFDPIFDVEKDILPLIKYQYPEPQECKQLLSF